MANRRFNIVQALSRETKLIYAKATIGAAGAPTLVVNNSLGVASIVRDSAGVYIVTLDDKYEALLHVDIMMLEATAEDITFQVEVEAVKTAKTVHDKQEAAKVTANEEMKASIRADLMKEFNIKPKPSEADKRKESALSTPNLTDATAKGDNSTPVESSKFDSDELFQDSSF